jgi:hypothetical protein
MPGASHIIVRLQCHHAALSAHLRLSSLWQGDIMDITQVILDDHHEQRRRFALIDDVDRSNKQALAALWERLSVFLEVHALAEEKHFYPALLKSGKGAGGKDSAKAETKDAIGDHNEIRDAVAKVGEHEVGSDDWFEAVAKAREANSDHMGEEERESLADFRRHATLQQRDELAVAFVRFEAENYKGVASKDKDVDRYIEKHG